MIKKIRLISIRLMILIFCILYSLKSYNQTFEQEVTVSLNSVKLFTTGAQLDYNSMINLQKGTTILKIKKLSSKLEYQSIYLFFSDSSIEILSVVPKTNLKEKNSEISIFEDSVSKTENRIIIHKNLISTYKNEQKLLYDIINNNSKSIQSVDIDKNLNYYNEKNNSINYHILKNENTIKFLELKKDSFIIKLQTAYQKQSDLLGEIDITVQTKKATICNLNLKYLVNAAGWAPKYDVKINYKSNKLIFIQKADIYNNTGVDWLSVPISLSTAQPDKLAEIPTLEPARFGREEYIQDDKKITKQTQNKNYNDTIYKYKTITIPEFIIEQQLSLNYNIPSDKKPYTVFVKEYPTKVKLLYIAVPKIEEKVYLSAIIPDFNNLNLISGEANIFLNDALVSRTFINDNGLDTFKLSLGQINTVKINRNKISGNSESSLISSKVKYSFSFEIVVQNFNEFPIQMQIIDQVPIATDKSVNVEILDKSDARLSNEGLLYWDFSLNSKERKVKSFAYSIKYPENTKLKNKKHAVISCPTF